MTKNIEQILHNFPNPKNRDQSEALADYFHSKKTQTKTDAARNNGIAPVTATKIEDAYDQLNPEEQTKLDLHLQKTRLETQGPGNIDDELLQPASL